MMLFKGQSFGLISLFSNKPTSDEQININFVQIWVPEKQGKKTE